MKRSRSNLARPPERGARVVIHVPNIGVVEARVQHFAKGGRIQCRYDQKERSVAGKTWHSVHTYSVRRRDEGRTWVREWNGESVNAFRVQVALS